MMQFKDKIVVITAAASGIGHSTCEIVGAYGGLVVAVDNDQERLDAAVDAMTKKEVGFAAGCATRLINRRPMPPLERSRSSLAGLVC